MNTPDTWDHRAGGTGTEGAAADPLTAGAEDVPDAPSAPAGGPAAPAPDGRLVPPDRAEDLRRRLREAVQGFVDSPEHSVARADDVLEETVRCVQDSLAERRRALRARWHGDGDGRHGTEEHRAALLDYRTAVERLTEV
ncbi:hypothetical protein [Streptomyces sp. YIM 98790]|uniref:hypothetical protein n=1 Tax=Streptomyces sp. YIM 98790 TaxID=2689077 RepID=UPI00140B633A|nr:hypothetical protein [Streptomyces sp. YIM 98790]